MERRTKEPNDLTLRIRTGALLTVLLLGVFWVRAVPGVMEGFSTLLTLLGCFEFLRALGLLKKGPWGWGIFAVSGAAGAVLPLISVKKHLLLLGAAFGGVLLASLLVLFQNRTRPFVRPPYSLGLLGSLCIAGSFSCLPALKDSPFTILLPFAACVLTDAMAYFGGRAFGKKPLAPQISPHKTKEGSLCGTLACTVVLWLLGFLVQGISGTPVYVSRLSVYGYIAAHLGQVGDLTFSLLKRRAGIKDYGRLLPGHGGLLDRFDSALFVLPFTVLFLHFYPLW